MAAAGNEVRCCGLAPVDNAAPAKPPAAAMWDAQAAWYGQWMSPSTSPLTFQLFSHLRLLTPGGRAVRVVETHCGDALAASMLIKSTAARAPLASYSFADLSEVMLANAKAQFSDGSPVELRFVTTPSTALPADEFPSGSFDRYLSNLGGCCVDDFRAKLSEARRVLAPGGLVAMSIRVDDPEGKFGDSSLGLLSRALGRFGMPPSPDREGLHIGKDLPRLRQAVEASGFTAVRAWRTTVPLSGVRDMATFREWAESNPMVRKVMGGLTSEEEKDEARAELDALAQEILEGEAGAMQLAAAIVVGEAI